MCGALIPGALAGQSVAGTVQEEGLEAAPVGGAFVSLIDEAGAQVGATFSNAAGTFFVEAPAPGSYRIRVERIGYEDWTSEVYRLEAGARKHVTARVPRRPVALADLSVRVSRACVTNPAQADALAEVWEEARKALETAVWAEGRAELTFSLREYERILDPERFSTRGLQVRHRVGVRLPPFESLPASELAESGYARFEGDTTAYYAPDATALLSQEFHDTHCFGLRREEGEGENLIALTFRPRPTQAVPEIEGALWLSEETAELRRVDFRYVHVPVLPGGDRRHLEGEVAFGRLPNGPFYVREWWLRLPVTGRTEVVLPGPLGRGPTGDRGRTVLAAYKEVGGSVTGVYAHGTSVFDEGGSVVRGLVRTDAGEVLAGELVALRDWDLAADFIAPRPGSQFLAAVTDSGGRFEIYGVPDGAYAIRVDRPQGRRLGMPPRERLVRVEEGRSDPVELTVPGPDAVYTRICPRSPLHRGEGAVVGIARDAGSGDPRADVRIEARWVIARVDVLPGGRLFSHDEARYAEATTDDAGLFVLCGLPGGESVLVRAAGEELGSEVLIDRRIVWQDVFVER